jgi:hypothetical protein
LNERYVRFHPPVVFVGERPSRTAYERGYTWRSGRLAASTLFSALREIGIDPESSSVHFENLWTQVQPDPITDRKDEVAVIGRLREATVERRFQVIVGLGKKVSKVLTDAGIPHVAITHPAARGKIRKRETYVEHVRERLGYLTTPETARSWRQLI